MKVLSATLSLPPALVEPAAGFAVGAGALAPVLNGGYWSIALLDVGRQSASTVSVRIAICEIISFFFISNCRLEFRRSAPSFRILTQRWTCVQASYSIFPG